MEHHLAIKKKEVIIHATTGRKFKSMLVKETGHKCYIF